MWAEDAQKQDDSDEETSEEEDSDEDSDDDAGPSSKATPAQELSREERRKEKKARKEAAIARAKAGAVQVGDLPPSDDEDDEEDVMPANPNHSKAARKQIIAAANPDVDEAAAGISRMAVKNQQPQSRRERETLEAAQAKERYMRLHEAGKTDEAKADLERLRKIREEREAAAARRKVSTSHVPSPCDFLIRRVLRVRADLYAVFQRPKKRRERSKRLPNVLRSRQRKPRNARLPWAKLVKRAARLRSRGRRPRKSYLVEFFHGVPLSPPLTSQAYNTYTTGWFLTGLSQRLRVDVVHHTPRNR